MALKLGTPASRKRRDIRHRPRAHRLGHAQGDNLAAGDHRQDRGRVRESQGNFAGRDRRRRRCAAAIGHGLHRQPKLTLQQFAGEIGRRAETCNAVAQGPGFRRGDEIGNRCDSRLGIGGQDQGAAHHLADRHQIGERIVIDPRQVDVDGDRAVREDDEGVAVRLASHQVFDADRRIGARLVFHDDALSDAVLQVLCDDARGQIDAAAGRIGHDNPDGPVRECFRVRGCGDGDDREQSDQPPLRVKEIHHGGRP